MENAVASPACPAGAAKKSLDNTPCAFFAFEGVVVTGLNLFYLTPSVAFWFVSREICRTIAPTAPCHRERIVTAAEAGSAADEGHDYRVLHPAKRKRTEKDSVSPVSALQRNPVQNRGPLLSNRTVKYNKLRNYDA